LFSVWFVILDAYPMTPPGTHGPHDDSQQSFAHFGKGLPVRFIWTSEARCNQMPATL